MFCKNHQNVLKLHHNPKIATNFINSSSRDPIKRIMVPKLLQIFPSHQKKKKKVQCYIPTTIGKKIYTHIDPYFYIMHHHLCWHSEVQKSFDSMVHCIIPRLFVHVTPRSKEMPTTQLTVYLNLNSFVNFEF